MFNNLKNELLLNKKLFLLIEFCSKCLTFAVIWKNSRIMENREKKVETMSYPENVNKLYEDAGVLIIDHLERLSLSAPKTLPSGTWCFMVVKNGELSLDIASRYYKAEKGDLIFCTSSSSIDKMQASPDFQGACMLLKTTMVETILPNNIDLIEMLFYVSENPVIHLSQEAKIQCLRYFQLIRFRTKHPVEFYNKEIVHSIIRALTYEWIEHLSCVMEKRNEPKAMKQGERLFKAFIVEVINDGARTRSVTEYASRLYVTPKYLSAVCKQMTGKTASDFINFFMIKEVKRMLLYTDKSIKEIAQTLGFPNLSFFGKYVKLHLGMSPTAYRKKKETDMI